MLHKLSVFFPACALVLASCAPGAANVYTSRATPVPSIASPSPAPSPTETPVASASPTELKYKLLNQYPDFFFCDPDFYPVTRIDASQLGLERFADVQANAEEFGAILAHNGWAGLTTFTDEQKLQIYADHKKLAAIGLEPAGEAYQFQLRTADGQRGLAIKGLIDSRGTITVQESTPTLATCPICLAAWTLIDTPHGPVPVSDLKVGDPVWTMTASGERVVMPLLLVRSVQVPATHRMVHLLLGDGRELWASPGHPTTDGRTLGALKIGDTLDGGRVTLVERAAYGQPSTYDLLPAGGTGEYWAGGILLASTLAPP